MVVLTEFVQGSSSSTHDHNHPRYDVFLSFRGADTRNNFTDHLYNALVDANITTFLDDEEIETGEDLKPELTNAIRSSRASIIVLSKNYATSTWCLDELALILEQRLTSSNHIVIPIFYHVEPTHVRKQQKSFEDAMANHKQRMEAETNAEKRRQWGQKIDRWNKALTQVADLKGKDVNGRKETEFIEEIVTDIHRRFGVPLSSDSLPLLIGMEDKIEEITAWLTDGSCSHAADILTITGMGGIGKTSLAKYVFHLYSRTFDKSSFIEGISSRCTQQFDGLLDVQKQLYGDISMKNNNLRVHDTFVYTSKIVKALARTKVFLVLDDIDTLGQLDALLGKKGFHPGSKIMITTRNASLTERCALFNPEVEPKHTKLLIEGLYESSALELLCLHAFKSKDPKAGYEEVIGKVVKYCEGHPLALEVLGRSLRNLDVNEWDDYVERLKKETDPSIKKVLKVSFDSLLSRNDKELFLHIACFFVGEDREYTETILKACGINTISGIRNLIDRCLLSVGWDNHLVMHQLLQEMGKDAVREESPDNPGKRSRLWCHEESFKVLKRKKGTENLKGLVLDTRMLEKVKLFELKTDAFCNMDNLMLLKLNYVQLSGSYESFPEDIRWLCMHGFPLKSIPADLPMENLVVLDMSYSKIKSFGIYDNSSNQQPPATRQKLIGSCSKDKQILGSLKILDLSFCKQLHTLGGFIGLPALERLIARNCISLTAICESLEECVDLVFIDLSYCINLEKVQTAVGKLKKVKTLLLDGCNNRDSQMKVRETDSQDMLVANSIGILSRTSSSAILESIPRELNFSVISFPSSLVRLSLANNNLSSESFPMDMSRLSLLKYLCLDGNPIVSMPSCVRSLPKLEELSMSYCDMLTSIEHPPCTLRVLNFWTPPNMLRLQRIVFDTEMSPLEFSAGYYLFRWPSFEIEGVVKIQPMAGVEEKVLRSLGWTNLDFIKERRIGTFDHYHKRIDGFETQMYYEFGIFSTIYGGEEMPNWISETSEGASISFTIPPSSPANKQQLRGLNFCYVQRRVNNEEEARFSTDHCGYPVHQFFFLPMIAIRNKTKSRTWIYKHFHDEGLNVGGEWLTYLSHWMFGKDDEMGAGDEITITLFQKYIIEQFTKECGVSLVYEGDGSSKEEEEEEDPLGYYKSWNHIIGGDLSSFQLTDGEYFLSFGRFFHGCGYCCALGGTSGEYKDKRRVIFRAFPKKKNA